LEKVGNPKMRIEILGVGFDDVSKEEAVGNGSSGSGSGKLPCPNKVTSAPTPAVTVWMYSPI
jgi:hypothetical protein